MTREIKAVKNVRVCDVFNIENGGERAAAQRQLRPEWRADEDLDPDAPGLRLRVKDPRGNCAVEDACAPSAAAASEWAPCRAWGTRTDRGMASASPRCRSDISGGRWLGRAICLGPLSPAAAEGVPRP